MFLMPAFPEPLIKFEWEFGCTCTDRLGCKEDDYLAL